MRTGLPRAAAVLASALGHLGWYQASVLLRGPAPARALRILQHWSRRTWMWLRLDVQMLGTPSATPCIYVSNHRSYLDIPVLSGLLGASFLSRADIAAWPVVGTAARAVGVVFVDRDDTLGRMRAARALARRVTAASVVVFPEGTTGGEPLPGPFHPGLFRLLHRLELPVVPLTIRYRDHRAYWVDDIALGEHLRTRVLDGPRLECTVHVGERIAPHNFRDADALAGAVRAAVCQPIEMFGALTAGESGSTPAVAVLS